MSYSGVAKILAGSLFLIQMYSAITVPFTTLIHRPLFVALTVIIIFLIKRTKSKIVDILLIILCIIPAIYVFINNADMNDRLVANNLEMVLGTCLIIMVLEATRRMLGWAIPVLALVFAVYGFVGPFLPDSIVHNGVSYQRMISANFMTASGIYGSFTGLSVSYLFLFIAFASLIAITGCGSVLIDLSKSMTGNFRGGPAKVAVVSSAFFSMISGSAVANTASTGSVTIPLMKQNGYKPHVAGAIEAIAGCAGSITPPIMGAAGFLLAQNLGIPYSKVIVFAILPAILFYFVAYLIVDLEAAKNNLGKKHLNDISTRSILRAGWYHLLPIVALVYFLVIAQVSPGRSIFWCIVLAIFFYVIKDRSLKNVWNAISEATMESVGVIASLAALGFVVSLIDMSGLGLHLSSLLISVAGGHTVVLLVLTMISSLILGMGLPTIACYTILATLAAPAMIQAGIHPYAAHLFVLFFGILSAVTPPVALGAYVAAGIAKTSPMKVGVQAFIFAIPTMLIPYMFVYNPELLLISHNVWLTVIVIINSLIALYSVISAIQGYIKFKASIFERVTLAVAGILCFYPSWICSSIGLILLVVAILSNVKLNKKDSTSVEAV